MTPKQETLQLRPRGAAFLAALGLLLMSVGAAFPRDRNAHLEALGALDDLRASIAAVTHAGDLPANAADPYKQAAQQAINALVGKDQPGFDAKAGNPGDEIGALGHLNWLHSQSGTPTWTSPVTTALVNVMAARAQLKEAIDADDPDGFRSANSAALQALLVALGRQSDTGALGGLTGALSTTDLGIPQDAKTSPGCVAPSAAPVFGVVKGYLTYVAIPQNGGQSRLPTSFGVTDVSVQNGIVVLHTAATNLLDKLCPERKTTHAAASDPKTTSDPATPATLYTETQAQRGAAVYAQSCAMCHGDRMQGKSAPPIAGAAFLKKAKVLGWSIADLRNVIVSTMPRSNPGSLSPQDYANVIAYLLAADCYPAGKQKFPTAVTPQIKGTDLRPLQAEAEKSSLGTCPSGAKQAAGQDE